MISNDQIDLLTRLYQDHYGCVAAAVVRFAPNSGCLDDIAQDVYLDFVIGAAKKEWDLEKDIGPLLFQIAKRKAQALWKKERKKRNCPIDGLAERLADDGNEGNETGSEAFLQDQEEIRALKTCMLHLPSKTRAIIEQYYLQGIPVKEIARQQEKTESTIYKFFNRVRLKLRECIAQRLNHGSSPHQSERS